MRWRGRGGAEVINALGALCGFALVLRDAAELEDAGLEGDAGELAHLHAHKARAHTVAWAESSRGVSAHAREIFGGMTRGASEGGTAR